MNNPEDSKSIDQLRSDAEAGLFDCCKKCPRRPLEREGRPIFAAGCSKHQTKKFPQILFVLEAPNKACEDGRVCWECHQESSDKTAKHLRDDLIPRLHIVPSIKGDDGRYQIYCINAVLHGKGKSKVRSEEHT